jgi:hypothetical protein
MLLTNVIMGQKVSCEGALLTLPRAQMERRGRGQSARRSRAMKPILSAPKSRIDETRGTMILAQSMICLMSRPSPSSMITPSL